MAIQADHLRGSVEAGPAPEYGNRSRAIARARRHTRHVRILRILLPVIAAAMGSLYFLSSGVMVNVGDMQASVGRIEINKNRLRMVDPKLEGVTDDSGTYTVTADYAEQEVANPGIVHLHAVRADVNSSAKGWTKLTAPKGLFETKKQLLTLNGDIEVVSNTGLTSYLTRADIDMKSQNVTSNEPVRVVFPNGHLNARTMHIAMKTHEITFAGDVKLHARPQPKPDAKKTAAGAADGKNPSFAKSFDRNQPIDIAAPALTIYDKQKYARFTGGVVTDQGGSRMISRELKVHYTGGGRDGGGQLRGHDAKQSQAMSGKLNRIEAIGDVKIVTADGRKASGAVLVYDAPSRRLVIDRNVTLTQKGNVLKGPRMVADLAKSITRFPPGGRVHGHFMPEPGKKPAARPLKSVELGSRKLDLSSSRGQPVDVEADTLTVYDARKEAIFSGNVHTVQGGMSLRSKGLKVFYGGGKDADGKGNTLSRVRAEGSVLITTDKDQYVTSDWALFDSTSQTVTIGGNVVLTQQENVIKGNRLVIDLKTGRSRFEDQGNVATNGRVRMLFTPKKAADKAKAAVQPDGR